MRQRKRIPLLVTDSARTAFGEPRTSCACSECVAYCKFLPGYLIPEDLGRMIPADGDPLEWARSHLLASLGAVVANSATGRRWRIPTLVPARAERSCCVFLDEEDRCRIHADAPFGCAFFDHTEHRNELSLRGLRAVDEAQRDPGSLYHRLWRALHNAGLVALSPEEGRARMSREQAPWWKRTRRR